MAESSTKPVSKLHVTDHERDTLRILAGAGKRGISANSVARQLWPDNPHWKQYYNSGGHGANLRMIAGKTLWRLRDKGLAKQPWGLYERPQNLWYITESGKAILDD